MQPMCVFVFHNIYVCVHMYMCLCVCICVYMYFTMGIHDNVHTIIIHNGQN